MIHLKGPTEPNSSEQWTVNTLSLSAWESAAFSLASRQVPGFIFLSLSYKYDTFYCKHTKLFFVDTKHWQLKNGLPFVTFLLTFARLVSHQAMKNKCFDWDTMFYKFVLWSLLDGLMECIVSTQVTPVPAAKTLLVFLYFYDFRHFWWYSH